MEQTPEAAERAFRNFIGMLLTVGGLMGAAAVPVYQVLLWLKTSAWKPMSVITALKWLGIEWAKWPPDWLGLHSLLDGTPLFFVLVVIGVIGIAIQTSD